MNNRLPRNRFLELMGCFAAFRCGRIMRPSSWATKSCFCVLHCRVSTRFYRYLQTVFTSRAVRLQHYSHSIRFSGNAIENGGLKVCTHTYMHTCMYTYTHIYTHTTYYINTYIYKWLYTYVQRELFSAKGVLSVYVYIYMYIDICRSR